MLSKNKFQNEDQVKTLSGVQKLREFITADLHYVQDTFRCTKVERIHHRRSALCTGKYYQCTKHNINTISLTVHVLKDLYGCVIASSM